MRMMRIQLRKKLANCLDGVDVSKHVEGDVILLPRSEAELLIAEGWALPFYGRRAEQRGTSMHQDPAVAADQSQRRPVADLRRAREAIETHQSEQQERRRAEDGIREERRDSRSTTLNGSNHTGSLGAKW